MVAPMPAMSKPRANLGAGTCRRAASSIDNEAARIVASTEMGVSRAARPLCPCSSARWYKCEVVQVREANDGGHGGDDDDDQDSQDTDESFR